MNFSEDIAIFRPSHIEEVGTLARGWRPRSKNPFRIKLVPSEGSDVALGTLVEVKGTPASEHTTETMFVKVGEWSEEIFATIAANGITQQGVTIYASEMEVKKSLQDIDYFIATVVGVYGEPVRVLSSTENVTKMEVDGVLTEPVETITFIDNETHVVKLWMSVTEIATGIFSDTDLRTLAIPANVTAIETQAFENMRNFTAIAYNSSVTIADGALQMADNSFIYVNGDGDVKAQQSDDDRIIPGSIDILSEGDMLFFDRVRRIYCIVKKADVAAVLADYDTLRYETNYDTYTGTFDGVAHFTASDDAVENNALYSDDVAATSCFYRIEIDNTAAGSLTFSAASGNASIASTAITWDANEAMADIVAKFVAKNTTYITFGALTDGKGVGLEIGGYGANTLTVTDSEHAVVIDCSGLAMPASANTGIAVGGDYNPEGEYTFIGRGVHHNFRGASAQSILGNFVKAPNTVCIANDGFNYSYRVGLNFSKFKEWASVSGDDTYYDDGEGGTDESVGHVMRKTRFDTEVTNYTGSDAHRLGMKEYYGHLLNDTEGDFADLRAEYEGRYGTMTDMYDAYLQSHMMDLEAITGTTADLRNYGKIQTELKADCINVNYNYKFIPAYPPEYNANRYGKESEGFAPGNYYHPETGDLGLMFRDDIMPLINANVDAAGHGTKLTNAMYRGSCGDYNAGSTWFFYGTSGCLYNNIRFFTSFRSRPVFALDTFVFPF